jgi:hypothetical protein
MIKRKLLLGALAVSSIAIMPLAASAAVDFYVNIAPPAPRYEVVPAPRAGYVWQPGVWEWRNDRHYWRKGYWVRERPGYYWHPSRWETIDGRYVMRPGGWHRERYAYYDNRGRGNPNGDRDRDGVPNKYDRDRDNDGVPNRYDDSPNNPRRY